MASGPPPVYSQGNTNNRGISTESSTPAYSAVFALYGRPTPGKRSARPLKQEHFFPLQSSKTMQATLKCRSRAASSSNAPSYNEGDDISGFVILNLASAQYISSLALLIKGRVITDGTEDGSCTFLDQSFTVWSKAHGDPRSASSPKNTQYEGRLTPGEYEWSFSIPLPTTVSLPTDPEAQIHHKIPQTFREHNASVTVQYDFVLHIGCGLLRPDKNITVPIIYTPNIIPEPASPLRQLAYLEGSPLLGPLADPEGWFNFPAVLIHGQLSDQHLAEAECKLSITTPLCYARGTVIPCRLTLRSTDHGTLDGLASLQAINVTLQRQIKYFQKAARRSPKHQVVQTSVLETAVWWPSGDVPQDEYERLIEGEIHLNERLQCSSDFPLFAVEYSVNLSVTCVPAFTPKDGGAVLATQPVSIGTFPAPGPRTREFATRMQTVPASPGHDPVPFELPLQVGV